MTTPHPSGPDEGATGWQWLAVGLLVVATAVLISYGPERLLAGAFGARPSAPPAAISAAPDAMGASREVRLQLVLPGERFVFPLLVQGDPSTLGYRWVSAADSAAVVPLAPLGSEVVAPPLPGFYRLAIEDPEGRRQHVDSVLVGVLVPYDAKIGSSLNGYRIGSYRWDAAAEDAPPPPRGFVEVTAGTEALAVSRHLALRDFVTHDGQASWPKYVALDPRVLDKVELVLALVAAWRGERGASTDVNVTSGFRTPLHNRRVPRAARDSRHQFGDAADIAVDANGDGQVTFADCIIVGQAVDQVERDHPELVGGLGLYGNFGGAPYVHIDVRGRRARWKG